MSLTNDPNDPGLRKIRADGQQETYLVLSDKERDMGFVRPVRRNYRHLKCGCVTHMGLALSETYARNFRFYTGTFCVNCGAHFDLREEVDGKLRWNFEWEPDGDPVGSSPEEADAYLADKRLREAEKDLGTGI